MKIHGMKKVTLIDYPGKIACTVFTYGCTLRCPFCHNPELVTNPSKELESMEFDELFSFLEKRRNKLDGVVLSGGEPLLHAKQLRPHMEKIRNLGYLIKIDTNGTFPKELMALIDDELIDFIAMDFKTTPEKYADLGASPENIEDILKSLSILLSSDIDYEIRTTLVPTLHTPEVLREMMPEIAEAKSYVLQNFEPNGMIDPSFMKYKPFTAEEMDDFLQIAEGFNSTASLRN